MKENICYKIFSVAPLIGVKRPNACNLHLPTDHTRRQAQGESEAMYSDSGAENDPLLSKGKPQPQRQKAKPLGKFSNWFSRPPKVTPSEHHYENLSKQENLNQL